MIVLTVYDDLYMACVTFQTGTVNIRRILAPLYTEDPEEQYENRVKFYADYDGAEQWQRDRVDAGVANAWLTLPERPTAPPDIPDDNPPPPPPPPTNTEPANAMTPTEEIKESE